MGDLDKNVDGKLVKMEEKFNNFKSHRQKPVRVLSEGIGKVKLLWFDGSSLLSVFKFQFETVASGNG